MACPNKNTKLYKRLNTQFSEDNVNRIWDVISSEEFDNWYGTRKRDSDGMPQVNKFLEIYGENLIAGSLLRKTISLKSVEDVTKLFSSNATQGIGKYQSAYYITKNNREQGIKMYDTLNAHYPGLLTLATRWKQTAAIGVTDRSEPVIKININDDVFNQGRLFKSEVRVEEEESKKESNLDFIINRLKEYSERLYNQIRDAQRDNETTKADSLIAQRDELKEAIGELESDKSLQNIAITANVNLDYAEKLLNKDVLTNAEINEVKNIISLYKNIASTSGKNFTSTILTEEDLKPVTIVDDNGNEIQDILQSVKDIKQVQLKANELDDKYDNLVQKTVTEASNKRFDEEKTKEDIFTNIKDVSKASKWFRDIGSVGNKLLSLLATINTDSSRLARQKSVDDQDELKEQSSRLKKSPLYTRLGRDKFMKLLWQTDEKGATTGGMINRYSSKYWSTRKKYHVDMRSKKTNVIKKAKLKHYANHEYVNYFVTEEEQALELARLTEKFGEKRATDIIDEMAVTFAEYKDRKEAYFHEVDNDDLSAGQKTYKKDIWLLKNDPKVTIEHLKSGTPMTDIDGKIVHGSFEFVKSIPKRIDSDGKSTGFYDTAYDQIEGDTIAFEYYNFTRDKIDTLLSYYPQAHLESKGIHKGFIPVLKKDILDKFREDGSISTLKDDTLSKISNLYTTKTYSKATNHIDPSTGVALDSLNIKMLSPQYTYVEDGKKVIDTSNVITDIDEVLNQFIPLSNMYHFKASVESQHKMTIDAINQLQGVDTTGTGDPMQNRRGESFTDSLKNIRELADFANNTFYEKQEKDQASSTKKLTKEDKAEASQLKQLLKPLEDELSTPDLLTEEEITKKTIERDSLKRQLEDLGVNYSTTKALKSTLRWYQLLAQGWSLTSPSIEVLYGRVSNLIHAKGGREYNSKQINTAYRIATGATLPGGLTPNSKKFKALVEKLDVVGEVAEIEKKRLNHSKAGFSLKRMIAPYEMMRVADMVSKGSVMTAMLMNTEIFDKDGNKSDLWNAYNQEGVLKDEFRTEANINNWETNFTETNSLLKLAEKIAQVNKRNHGNYDSNSPILANSSAGGKALLQFRRWMLEGFATRWEGTRQDDFLGREVRGRYTTLSEVSKQFRTKGVTNPRLATLGVLFKSATYSMTGRSITDAKLIELGVLENTDQENMRKNAAGLMYAVGTWIALMLVKATLLDDDDKDKASVMNFLLNQGGRLQQDLFFYADPSTTTDVTKNFIPAVKLIDKIYDWGANVAKLTIGYDEDYDAEYDGRSPFDGWNKSFIKTGELIPGTASWIKAYRAGSKIYE